jgi:hypothetical protein
MPLPEFLKGAKGKAVAAFLAVFLAGGGAGYIAGRWQAHFSFREAALERRMPASFARGGRQLRRLRRDLHLRDDQFTRVNNALQRHLEEMQLLRREMRPQLEKLLLEARGELRSILDFDEMVRTFGHDRRRWRDRMMRRFFPGGMGSMMRGGVGPHRAAEEERRR